MVEIRLLPSKEGGGGLRWKEEWLGLATAFLEAGFADLLEVIPVVEGNKPSRGFADTFTTGRRSWTGTVAVAARDKAIEFSLQLCDPDGACDAFAAVATAEAPEAALSALLEQASTTLGKGASQEARAGWKVPLSRDPYAILLAGRSAATFYGLLPPVPDERIGDRRRDPITRAVSVDPSLALSQWLLARRGFSLPRGAGGSQPAKTAFETKAALERATVIQPWRVIFRADLASSTQEPQQATARGNAVISRTGSSRAWDLVQALAPDQIRFLGGRIGGLIADREWEPATRLLEAVPEAWEDDPRAIVAEVAIAEGVGPGPGYDQLLARWQLAARMDPEPIRRRIALRIREARYDEALAFARSLEERGAVEEAAKLSMSLGLAIGDYELAAEMADTLDLEETALRIRARAALEKDPTRVPKELERANEPVEWVARGVTRLRAGAAAEALFDADAALKVAPWMPEALALRMGALEALGRRAEASRAREALRWADPSWPIEGTEPRRDVQALHD